MALKFSSLQHMVKNGEEEQWTPQLRGTSGRQADQDQRPSHQCHRRPIIAPLVYVSPPAGSSCCTIMQRNKKPPVPAVSLSRPASGGYVGRASMPPMADCCKFDTSSEAPSKAHDLRISLHNTINLTLSHSASPAIRSAERSFKHPLPFRNE
jgi:hypothetical protein